MVTFVSLKLNPQQSLQINIIFILYDAAIMLSLRINKVLFIVQQSRSTKTD